MEYCVYKISSNTANSVYYGYCQGDKCFDSFIVGATRAPVDNLRRGAVEWLHENNNDTTNIKVEIVEVCDDEYDAWCMRNDYRTRDNLSITGLSNWPVINFEKTKLTNPERINNWKKNRQINECKTAREASKLGAFTYPQIKQLSEKYPREQIVKDLDGLNPHVFSIKYNIPITYTNK